MEERRIEERENTKKERGENPQKKRRGRKRIKERRVIEDKKKFFIDYTNEDEKHELVVKLITEANKKPHGKEVTFKDLVDYALEKLTAKDLEKIKTLTLQEMDKIQMLLEKHNLKHRTNLTLGEFLVKQLKIL